MNRNMNNLFEGVEDPFADDFLLDSPPVLNKNASKGALKAMKSLRKGGPGGGDFEYFVDDGSQSVTPTNNPNEEGGFMMGSMVNKPQHLFKLAGGSQATGGQRGY